MSQPVITSLGRLRLAMTAMQASSAPTMTMYCALYTNDLTPNRNTVMADITLLTTDPTSVLMPDSSWQTPSLVSNKARTFSGTDYTTLLNDSGAPATVYGFVVVDYSDDTLLWAERFDDAIELADGAPIKLWPYYEFTSTYDPTP